MNRKARITSSLAATAALWLLTSFCAAAQSRDVGSFITSIESTIKGLSDNLVDIALMLVGLVGAVMVIPNLIKHAKHDPNASDAFIKLGTGLIIAFVIIQVARLLF